MARAQKPTEKFVTILNEIHPDLGAWAQREFNDGATVPELKQRIRVALVRAELLALSNGG